MSHQTTIKVRGYHLDLYGHVNNARYLEFLEEARWGYFEDRGDLAAFVKLGLAFVIVNININYRRPAMMSEVLQIETELRNVGNRSCLIHQTVMLKDTDTLVAEADITFVLVDPKTGKSVIIEGEARGLLEKYL